MKRTLILLALAALPLSGCSGKAKAPDSNLAAAGASKHNPWSVDGASDAVPDPEAKPAAEQAPAKDAAAAGNPWSKEPPPGAEPAGAAVANAKPKGK